MCLGIPVEVIEIKKNKAVVSAGGASYEADLSLVSNIFVGDYVLLHAGYVLQKISKEDALETINIIKQIAEIDQS